MIPPVVSSASLETLEFPWGTLTWHVSRALGNSAEMTEGRMILKTGMAFWQNRPKWL